jgi:hypothetical protein
MSRFVRKDFGTWNVLVVHIMLSLAGRVRSAWFILLSPKTKDCAVDSVEPPVLLLILQENQDTWAPAWGDFAAPRTSPVGDWLLFD